MKTKNSEALVSLQDNLFSWRPAICITHPRRRTEQVPQVTIPKNYRWGREKKGEQNGITLCVIEGKKAQRSVQFWGKNRARLLRQVSALSPSRDAKYVVDLEIATREFGEARDNLIRQTFASRAPS